MEITEPIKTLPGSIQSLRLTQLLREREEVGGRGGGGGSEENKNWGRGVGGGVGVEKREKSTFRAATDRGERAGGVGWREDERGRREKEGEDGMKMERVGECGGR